jgi:hypothetical protein
VNWRMARMQATAVPGIQPSRSPRVASYQIRSYVRVFRYGARAPQKALGEVAVREFRAANVLERLAVT